MFVGCKKCTAGLERCLYCLNIYKGNGDKKKCSNYREISLLSVIEKIFGRILFERVKPLTEISIGKSREISGKEVCVLKRILH